MANISSKEMNGKNMDKIKVAMNLEKEPMSSKRK
jgi:hypothetical protein